MKKIFALFSLLFAKEIALWANKAEEKFTKRFAKASYGNIITEMSGSIGHNTYQKGRYGDIVRVKGRAINRNTSPQAIVRAFFSTLTKAWKSLTDAQRAGFNTGTAVFTKKDSLAKTITLTGAQLFISLNRNLQTIGQATISAMPFKRAIAAVTSATCAAAAGAATMVLTYSPAIPATDSWILRATRPLSAGKQSQSQDYKIIDIELTADASPLNIKAAYEAVFGTNWKTAGAKIFFAITPVGNAEGIQGTTYHVTSIVAA